MYIKVWLLLTVSVILGQLLYSVVANWPIDVPYIINSVSWITLTIYTFHNELKERSDMTTPDNPIKCNKL